MVRCFEEYFCSFNHPSASGLDYFRIYLLQGNTSGQGNGEFNYELMRLVLVKSISVRLIIFIYFRTGLRTYFKT